MRALDLVPVAEFQLTTDTIRKFRTGYVAAFGAPSRDDQLYEAVSEGRRYPGMEHWLPLFHDQLDTLFDYLPDSPVVLEPLAEEAAHERLGPDRGLLRSAPRTARRDRGAPYKPLPPDRLYLTEKEWKKRLDDVPLAQLTPFAVPEGGQAAIDIGTRQGHNFAPSAPSRMPMCSMR